MNLASAPRTFKCPHCNYDIPATMPQGIKFLCPVCRANIVAPEGSARTKAEADAYQQWFLQHANTAISAAAANRQDQEPGREFFAQTSRQTLVFVNGHPLIVGSQIDANRTWFLRALDPMTQQIIWDTLQGSHFAKCPAPRDICCRAGRIYLEHQGYLHSLDGSTGRLLWRIHLSAEISHGGASLENGDSKVLYDVYPQAQRSIIVYKEHLPSPKDGSLVALDRDTGEAVWRDTKTQEAIYVPYVGILSRKGTRYRLLDGATGNPVSWFSDKVENVTLAADQLVADLVDDEKDFDEHSLAVIDPRRGTVVNSVKGEYEFDVAPQPLGNGYVCVSAREDGTHVLAFVDMGAPASEPGFFAKLFGKKANNTVPLPFSKPVVEAMKADRGAIALKVSSLEDDDAGPRIVLLDAATRTVKYDSGPLGNGASDTRLTIAGGRVIYVVESEDDEDPHTAEIRALDCTSGQQAWSRPIPHLDDYYVAGEFIVVYGDTDITVLRASDGAFAFKYPAPNGRQTNRE